jgi:hypothetical protein
LYFNDTLSVVVITFNEEKQIGRCIDSVLEIADEIVILDSYSGIVPWKLLPPKVPGFTARNFWIRGAKKQGTAVCQPQSCTQPGC